MAVKTVPREEKRPRSFYLLATFFALFAVLLFNLLDLLVNHVAIAVRRLGHEGVASDVSLELEGAF